MNSKRAALLEFYADWCAPCLRVSPIVVGLAHEFEGKIRLVRVNVDTESVLVDKYRVYSLPTVVFVVGGREVDRMTGAKTKGKYRAAIIKALRKRRPTKS
jgi:thioredoxin 1